MYNEVNLYENVDDIIDLGEFETFSEMTEFEKSFLIGLLKQKQPSKIMEIGVAAGATTAIISAFLEKEKKKAILYSIDLNHKMWNNPELDTGFVLRKFSNGFEYVKNELLTGYTVAHWIEKIGNNIEFLIIDTTHTLPGEVLDFLVCFPFLADNAVVVLHDVALNHTAISSLDDISKANFFSTAYSTKVLLTAVHGKKFYMHDDSNPYEISNIAAFEINHQTKEEIENVFSSLTLTWNYVPDSMQWKEYSKVFSKYYNLDLAEKAEKIYCLQKRMDSFRGISGHYKGEIKVLYRKWKKEEKVYIYGCGFYGDKYYYFAKENNLPLNGMIVSDGVYISKELQNKYDCEIYHISDVASFDNDAAVLIATSGAAYQECIDECINRNFISIL